jgi:transposase
LIAESKLKNDKVDAEVLARLVRLDPEFLQPIQHRSDEAQLLHANLKVRSAMVEARTKWINTIRGLLRSFGYKVSGKAPHTFVDRVDRMKLTDELRAVIEPLLEQLDLLTGEIDRRNEHVEEMVKDLPEIDHLRKVPGVGPVVATYFVLTIGDPHRFKNSRDVAPFFGLATFDEGVRFGKALRTDHQRRRSRDASITGPGGTRLFAHKGRLRAQELDSCACGAKRKG